MTVTTQHIQSANRIIENVRWMRVLIHPNVKKILMNIEMEKCKISKSKLAKILIEFKHENWSFANLPSMYKYKLYEVTYLQLGNELQNTSVVVLAQPINFYGRGCQTYDFLELH